MDTHLRRFIISCGLLSLLGLMLFAVGAITNDRLTHVYLFWNLLLAWIPLLDALLIRYLFKKDMKQPFILVSLAFVWLLFLPNTFYMLTDYVHIMEVARVDPISDSVMFSVVITTGFILGIASVFLIHTALLRIISQRLAAIVIGLVLAASSFAIYLGRELRFNSWDIITNPLRLTRDVVHILFRPHQNIDAYVTSLTFFIVTIVVYALVWYILGTRTKKA
ncbi:MAG: DUF1361 domain-containing protein [Candidatus Saccharimonadales bacterium]